MHRELSPNSSDHFTDSRAFDTESVGLSPQGQKFHDLWEVHWNTLISPCHLWCQAVPVPRGACLSPGRAPTHGQTWGTPLWTALPEGTAPATQSVHFYVFGETKLLYSPKASSMHPGFLLPLLTSQVCRPAPPFPLLWGHLPVQVLLHAGDPALRTEPHSHSKVCRVPDSWNLRADRVQNDINRQSVVTISDYGSFSKLTYHTAYDSSSRLWLTFFPKTDPTKYKLSKQYKRLILIGKSVFSLSSLPKDKITYKLTSTKVNMPATAWEHSNPV